MGGGNFEKAYEKAELLISQICNFLTERDLEPCFILIPDNSDKNFDETCLPLFKGRKCVLKVLTSISDYNWGTIEMIINEKYSNGNYK